MLVTMDYASLDYTSIMPQYLRRGSNTDGGSAPYSTQLSSSKIKDKNYTVKNTYLKLKEKSEIWEQLFSKSNSD